MELKNILIKEKQYFLRFILIALVMFVIESSFVLGQGINIFEILNVYIFNFVLINSLMFLIIIFSIFQVLKKWFRVIYYVSGIIFIYPFIINYLLPVVARGVPIESIMKKIVLMLLIIPVLLFFYIYNKIICKFTLKNSIFYYSFLLLIVCTIIPASSNRNESIISHNSDSGNVILFTCDALRSDHINKKTWGLNLQNIRNLKNDSVNFLNYYTVSNVTNPSFASLFTGKNQSDHKLFINGYKLKEKNITLAEVFRKSGYKTAAFSRNVSYRSGIGQGFQYFFHLKRGLTTNGQGRTFKGAIETVFDRIKREISGNDLINHAIEWIGNNKYSPFFVWIHLYDTHLPYNPPREFRGDLSIMGYEFFDNNQRMSIYEKKQLLKNHEIESIRDLYAGEVKHIDKKLGRFIEFLKKNNLYKNTLFIFSSDHGEALYEKEYWIGHNRYLFNNIINIPLLIKPAGQKGIVFKSDEYNFNFSNIYLAQSILDIVGIDFKLSQNCIFDNDRNLMTKFPDIFSFNYEEIENTLNITKISMISGNRKLIFDNTKFNCFKLSFNEDKGSINNKDLKHLKDKMKLKLNKSRRLLTSQKIPEKVKDELKSIGYLNQKNLNNEKN